MSNLVKQVTEYLNELAESNFDTGNATIAGCIADEFDLPLDKVERLLKQIYRTNESLRVALQRENESH